MKIGDVLSNEELRKKFAVGNMGGMRRSKKKNLLVIISDETDWPPPSGPVGMLV